MPDQMEFIRKLEQLADKSGQPNDDETRELLAEIEEEFKQLKRGAVREGYETDERVTVQDVLNFGAEIGRDFPNAQKGCEVFASVAIIEKRESAPLN